ncbi:MAG: hypothetical protein VX737_00335 [Pseudomonadota bacterium]|nr:hypothetical protein [Pseudomonadota bacterium]
MKLSYFSNLLKEIFAKLLERDAKGMSSPAMRNMLGEECIDLDTTIAPLLVRPSEENDMFHIGGADFPSQLSDRFPESTPADSYAWLFRKRVIQAYCSQLSDFIESQPDCVTSSSIAYGNPALNTLHQILRVAADPKYSMALTVKNTVAHDLGVATILSKSGELEAEDESSFDVRTSAFVRIRFSRAEYVLLEEGRKNFKQTLTNMLVGKSFNIKHNTPESPVLENPGFYELMAHTICPLNSEFLDGLMCDAFPVAMSLQDAISRYAAYHAKPSSLSQRSTLNAKIRSFDLLFNLAMSLRYPDIFESHFPDNLIASYIEKGGIPNEEALSKEILNKISSCTEFSQDELTPASASADPDQSSFESQIQAMECANEEERASYLEWVSNIRLAISSPEQFIYKHLIRSREMFETKEKQLNARIRLAEDQRLEANRNLSKEKTRLEEGKEALEEKLRQQEKKLNGQFGELIRRREEKSSLEKKLAQQAEDMRKQSSVISNHSSVNSSLRGSLESSKKENRQKNRQLREMKSAIVEKDRLNKNLYESRTDLEIECAGYRHQISQKNSDIDFFSDQVRILKKINTFTYLVIISAVSIITAALTVSGPYLIHAFAYLVANLALLRMPATLNGTHANTDTKSMICFAALLCIGLLTLLTKGLFPDLFTLSLHFWMGPVLSLFSAVGNHFIPEDYSDKVSLEGIQLSLCIVLSAALGCAGSFSLLLYCLPVFVINYLAKDTITDFLNTFSPQPTIETIQPLENLKTIEPLQSLLLAHRRQIDSDKNIYQSLHSSEQNDLRIL